jgi:hypothetical protein
LYSAFSRHLAALRRLEYVWQPFKFDAEKVASSNFRPGGFCLCDSSVYIKETDVRIGVQFCEMGV